MFDAAVFVQEKWQGLSTGGGNFPRRTIPELLDYCRMYDNVFLCFDNDDSGNEFLFNMSKLLFEHGINFTCGHVPPYMKQFEGGTSMPITADLAEQIRVPADLNNGQESDRTIDGAKLIKIKDVNDYYCAGGNLDDLVKSAVPGLIEYARSCNDIVELTDLFKQASRHYKKAQLFQLKNACQGFIDTDGFAKFSKKESNFAFMQGCSPLSEKEVAELVDQKHNLLYDVSGSFYEYHDGYWEQIADVIVQRYAGQALNMFATSGRMVSAANFLKISHAGRYEFNRKPVFVFTNGTLDLNEPDQFKRFRESSPDDMNTSKVNYAYNHSAIATKWLRFVDRAMGGNEHKKKLLQQIAGYVLFADNRLQKFFYLYGDGRNGKSTYLNILKAVYGDDKTTSVPFSRLGSQFDPVALKDSWLNLCYEAKAVLRDGEDTLKAVVGGDPIMAAHKGVDAITFTTRAKLFVAANKLFTSDDVSLGLLRRIIFMKFDNVIPVSEDNKNLYSELLEELPGIFNWCYEGYLDLVHSGEFEETEQHFDALEEFLDQMSPAMIFTRECLVKPCERLSEILTKTEGADIDERVIYDIAKTWALEGNYKLPNRAKFISDLRQIIRQMAPDIRVFKDKQTRLYSFRFLDWREDEKEEVDHNVPIILPAAREAQTEEAVPLDAGGQESEAEPAEAAGDVKNHADAQHESRSTADDVRTRLDLLESLNGTSSEDSTPAHDVYEPGADYGENENDDADTPALGQVDGVFSRPEERPMVKRPVPYNEMVIAQRVAQMCKPAFSDWARKLAWHIVSVNEWEQFAYYLYCNPQIKSEHFADFDEQYAAWMEEHKNDPRGLLDGAKA